jgi:SAM-dependent methyltransferase
MIAATSTTRAMRLPPELRCPTHACAMEIAGEGEELRCLAGCHFPVVRSIPRFVPSSGYATSFGLQWNNYRTAQLDSHTGAPISRERLSRCLGGTLDLVREKSVLEVGCGAGRFSEILLEAGARVFAFDLSDAVEASYTNFGLHARYFVCQADLQRPPALRESFDVVVCLGVIQHTPDPAQTIRILGGMVKPGGLLVVDHYALQYHGPSRRLLRWVLLRLPSRTAFLLVRLLCRLLIPLHRLLRPPYRWRGQFRLRNMLLGVSPVIDYYEAFPALSRATREMWMELDTHDGLTDYHKHMRTLEEIKAYLANAGLAVIGAAYAGNGIEALARKPT